MPTSHPQHPTLLVVLLEVMESHGEVEIRRHPSCSHCPLKDCQWQAELQLAACVCPEGMKLAEDNITCTGVSYLCPGSDSWVIGWEEPWALGKMVQRPAVDQALLGAGQGVGGALHTLPSRSMQIVWEVRRVLRCRCMDTYLKMAVAMGDIKCLGVLRERLLFV